MCVCITNLIISVQEAGSNREGNNREGGNALDRKEAGSDTLDRREAGSSTLDREELQAGECVWGVVSCD